MGGSGVLIKFSIIKKIHIFTFLMLNFILISETWALGVGAGDEVITVPYTWISTAEVVALLGAKPVFVDIRPDTWNMDETQVEASITDKTKAIRAMSKESVQLDTVMQCLEQVY